MDETQPDDKRLKYCKAALAGKLNAKTADTIAAIYVKEEEYNLAIEMFTMAQSIDGSDSTAAIGKCRIAALITKNTDMAVHLCDAASQLSSDDPALLDAQGIVAFRLNHLDVALNDFNAAITRDPKRPYSLFARGIILQRAGNAAGSDSDIQAALALNPDVKQALDADGIAP